MRSIIEGLSSYAADNRLDECDRTPEVLAADLQDAMQQLWGRSELVFN
jgi:hypothetical protein